MALVASTYSTDDEVLEKKGQTGLTMRGEIPELNDVGWSMSTIGDVSQPFQVSNGWMVIKLLEIAPPRIFTLEEARSQIDGALREKDNDKLLNELLAKWKDEFKVVIHEDNLKKVKLPDRPQDAVPSPKGKKEKDQLTKS